MSERLERIASKITSGGMEQGWFEGRASGLLTIWTSMSAYDESISFQEAEDLRKRAERVTRSTASKLGRDVEAIRSSVTVSGRKPAIVVYAAISGLDSGLEGLKEGRP